MTYNPQVYAPIFCSINSFPQTEVHQIDIDMESGATDVETIARQWAGVVQGAARIDFTLHMVIPFQPTDVAGTGFTNLGIEAGSLNGAPVKDLINTMITAGNANQVPCQFAFGIGGVNNGVTGTQLAANGFIKKAAISYSTKSTPEIVFSGTAQFTYWT
jgi:hypothetical protein